MDVESLRNELFEDLNKLKLEDKCLSDSIMVFVKLPSIKKSFELLVYQRCNPHILLFTLCLCIVILRLRCFRTQIKGFKHINTILQEYNSNLQADATKNTETIAKLQKTRYTMIEKMNGLKDHTNSVKMQLDFAKVKSLYIMDLCDLLEGMVLQPDVPNVHAWRFSESGE